MRKMTEHFQREHDIAHDSLIIKKSRPLEKHTDLGTQLAFLIYIKIAKTASVI